MPLQNVTSKLVFLPISFKAMNHRFKALQKPVVSSTKLQWEKKVV